MSVQVFNCRDGELVIRAPQCELDKLVTQIEASGGTVQRARKKPTPLGVPVMNFERTEDASYAGAAAGAARSSNEFKPTPLGVPEYDWAPIKTLD